MKSIVVLYVIYVQIIIFVNKINSRIIVCLLGFGLACELKPDSKCLFEHQHHSLCTEEGKD